jgi:hypothetical protein
MVRNFNVKSENFNNNKICAKEQFLLQKKILLVPIEMSDNLNVNKICTKDKLSQSKY